jgi:hypothetical protein
MSTSFDFKEAARKLMAQIFNGPTGTAGNKDLVRTAIEVALRDAYSKGQGDIKKPPSPSPSPTATVECDHRWQESFLDGRAVGVQCAKCGILERDIKSQCEHFFVKSGSQEVCVACRATRRLKS